MLHNNMAGKRTKPAQAQKGMQSAAPYLIKHIAGNGHIACFKLGPPMQHHASSLVPRNLQDKGTRRVPVLNRRPAQQQGPPVGCGGLTDAHKTQQKQRDSCTRLPTTCCSQRLGAPVARATPQPLFPHPTIQIPHLVPPVHVARVRPVHAAVLHPHVGEPHPPAPVAVQQPLLLPARLLLGSDRLQPRSSAAGRHGPAAKRAGLGGAVRHAVVHLAVPPAAVAAAASRAGAVAGRCGCGAGRLRWLHVTHHAVGMHQQAALQRRERSAQQASRTPW